MTYGEEVAAFFAAFRGLAAPALCRAFNAHTPGVNWTGCNKATLADSWARRDHHRRRDNRLQGVSLADLVATLRKDGAVLCACATCACTDIQCTSWVFVNTGKDAGGDSPTDAIYCPQCDFEVSMVDTFTAKPYREVKP